MSDLHLDSSFYKQLMDIDNYFKIKEWHDSSIGTLYNVCAAPWGVLSTMGVFSTVGGYHEYRGVFSTVGDIMINVGIS